MWRICIAEVCVRSSVSGCGALGRAGAATAGSRRGRKRLRQVERVLHVAGRMLLGHVEGFEVVLVVLDLRPFEHLVAEPREDRLDFLAHQAERMAMAERRRRAPAG